MIVTLIALVGAAVLVILKLAGHRMSLTETSVAIVACLVVFSVTLFLERRPYRPGKFNYHFAMLVLLITGLVLGRYMLELTTGY